MSNTDSKTIVILGSGPTGLGAAHRLFEVGALKKGYKIIILDKYGKAGGLSSSRKKDGFTWDLGGHVVFSHYKYFDYMREHLGIKFNTIKRSAYVITKCSDGERYYVPYPLQNNINHLPLKDKRDLIKGLEEATRKDEYDNFDDWIMGLFGSELADFFMRPYNKKVWTVDPKEMDHKWVAERVSVPDVDVIKQKSSEEPDDDPWGPNNVFSFPERGGTGAIWRAVYDQLPSAWFKFEHEVKQIDIKSKTITVKNGDNTIELDYDSIISTLPLDDLVNMTKIDDQPCPLRYSTVHVIGFGMDGKPPPHLKTKSWMYFPNDDAPFYRVTVFSNYSSKNVRRPGRQWSLMCEIGTPVGGESEPANQTQLIDESRIALISYGMIDNDKVVTEFYTRLDKGYPIPTIGRDEYLDKIIPQLESNNIWSRGRFGGWKYEVSNQDHSFMQGVEAVDNIMFGDGEVTYFDPNKINMGDKNESRLWKRPDASHMDLEYVVAHYNEPLDWLDVVRKDKIVHIYHKGGNSAPDSRFSLWEKLPNVGREAHTYLTHIIQNYDKLADKTVFLQGRVDDHQKEGLVRRDITDYERDDLYKNGINILRTVEYNNWGKIEHKKKWLKEWENSYMTRSRFTLAQFWEAIFEGKKPHPDRINASFGACFAVTREAIRQHPIQFYKRCRTFLDNEKCVNPEEGHYMERIWYSIFAGF